MNYISLFTGIGGFDLGFDRVGMQCILQCEIDKYCNQVLNLQFPDTPKLGDIRDFRGGDYATNVNVICGGFPCQGLSVAGKREGLADERSGLWFEFHRVITEIQPEWVVIENVPGLLSSCSGRDFAILLGGLTGIIPEVPRSGWGNAGAARGPIYNVAYRVVDAQYFGVPQRRRRVFIVGHLGGSGGSEVLFESEGSPWDSPPSRQAWERVADPITRSFAKHGGASAGNDSTPRNMIVQDTAHALMSHAGRNDPETENFVAFQQNTRDEVRYIGGDGQIAGALSAQAGMKQQNYVASVSPPLRARGGITSPPTLNKNNSDLDFLVSGTQVVRRLTPTEAERLQGFPDGWTQHGMDNANHIEISDSQRYKMLGNAVCVNVAEWVGKRLVSL